MPNNGNDYIRPRRGTRTVMTETEKAALILKEGELFFEFPDEGIGKAPAKVKIGDGVSAYSQLDYVLGNEAFFQEIDFVEERSEYTQTLIDEIVSGVTLSKFTANAKRIMQLLLNKFGEYLPLTGGTIDGNLIVNGDVKSESATLKSEASGSTKFVASNVQNTDVEVIAPDHAGTLALISDFPISDDYDATSGSAMSGKAVNKALQTLDVTGDSNIAANKTIKSWSETDGKVSITTQNISITKSQVSDFPTIGNGTLTIQKNGSNVATFTANQTGNATANIGVPTALSDLTQNANYRTVSDTEKSTWNNKASTAVATQSANGLMSSGDKKKLDGIDTGAELNQNAYSYIDINGIHYPDLYADLKMSTLKFSAGSNMTIYPLNTSKGWNIEFSATDQKVDVRHDTSAFLTRRALNFIAQPGGWDSYNGNLLWHEYLLGCTDRWGFSPQAQNTNKIDYRGAALEVIGTRNQGSTNYNISTIVAAGTMYFGQFDSSGQYLWTGGGLAQEINGEYSPIAMRIYGGNGDEAWYIKWGIQNNGEAQDTWGFVPWSPANGPALGSPADGNKRRWRTVFLINQPDVSSDRNLKKNITDLNDDKVKDFIMDLKPVSFNWKTDSDDCGIHLGLIAQDVEETINKFDLGKLDLLSRNQQTKEVKETTTKINEETGKEEPITTTKEVPIEGEYVYSLKYNEFIAPLIQMVQQQQKEIDELKKKVDELSKK